MQPNHINRRGFLRLCFLGASGVIAAACGSQPDLTIPAEKTTAATPRLPDGESAGAGWLDKSVLYRVTPGEAGSRFDRLAGRLGALQSLGANLLWLGQAYRPLDGERSSASAAVDLNPQYGGREDLLRLVEQAHRLGMRVLVDFPAIPAIDAYARWVREFGVDGFRLDSAWEAKASQAEFWPLLRRELKRLKPDLLLLAQASAGDPFYFDHGFDAAQDWAGEDGRWAWDLVFAAEGLLTSNLHAALLNRPAGYHPAARVLRSLNDESRARFVSKHGLEMTRLATALLFTLPGLPCLYSGDETGETSPSGSAARPEAETRGFPGLLEYHQKLIQLRKDYPSLHSRHWVPLEVDPLQNAYGILRYTETDEPPVLVLLNFLEPQVELEVNLPPEFHPWFAASSALQDLLTGETVQLASPDPFRVVLPGRSVNIITQKI